MGLLTNEWTTKLGTRYQTAKNRSNLNETNKAEYFIDQMQNIV